MERSENLVEIPAFIAVAVCGLGPWLITPAGAGLLWAGASLGEFGGLIVPAAILLIVWAWREGGDRRACCGLKSSHPNEP